MFPSGSTGTASVNASPRRARTVVSAAAISASRRGPRASYSAQILGERGRGGSPRRIDAEGAIDGLHELVGKIGPGFANRRRPGLDHLSGLERRSAPEWVVTGERLDRKSTRLNSSHVKISYAVFCLKKK